MEATKIKKIFIVTGEASGDKLASTVINNLNKLNWDKGFYRKDIGFKVIDK